MQYQSDTKAAKNSINSDLIPRDSLAMRLTLDPRSFDVNEKKKLKEKLKILKDAVLEERRLKNEIKNNYDEVRSNYEKAIQELESKDQDIIKKQNEISKFRELLILERNQKEKFKEMAENGKGMQNGQYIDYNNTNQSQLKQIQGQTHLNQSSLLSNVSSLFGFGGHSQQLIKEEQYKDLLEKFQKINFQYERLEEKYQEQEDLNLQQMSAYEDKVKIVKDEKEQLEIEFRENQKLLEDLQETNKILVNQQSDIKRDNQTFLKKIEDLNNKLNEITKQFTQQEKQIKEYQNEIVNLENKTNSQALELESKTQTLNSINNVVMAQKQENEELLKKLDDIYQKKQNKDSELNILCYNFKRLQGLSHIDTQLEQGKKVLDFECSSETLISTSEQIKKFKRRAPKSKKKPIINAQLNIVSQGKNQGSLINGVFSMFKN
ncbi:hypothetical protein PPERSA_06457 [Pseudocohnilembus persalinus]|uniref:Uncharacterized protein n=1 Tax=Pseudocohnilembus persalinus TaxID=266149 RepID=A0A0V0QRS6_PSEPJ|nr:hypothetical protein PPERSA_06457 [Pseudocohnilembus persalinus]|eukprot:KRX04823.1 hypothetical protein PPERSA_06457 [Pseudocohnilembus persalinus]